MIPENERVKVVVRVFGGPQEEREYHTKCNTLICTGPDLIGRVYDWCGCKK